ncbi:MAG: TIGR02444 family protein [Alteromonadaceae bacterium]|nr:TIGR02444 family protein [Alteromonadaceae bacterium]
MAALTNDAFWQHSLAVYSKPGVAEACLTLQDRYQVNVNLLLLLHWCNVHQYCVDAALIERLKQRVAQTDPAIQRHRQQRRAAKGTDNYEALKAAELALEAEQQSALVAELNQSSDAQAEAGNSDDLVTLLTTWLNLPDTPTTRLLIDAVINA